MSARTEIIREARGEETPAQRNAHGKKFERYLQDECFGALNNEFPVEWKRILDAAAANDTTIGKAKGDFTFQLRGPTLGNPYLYLVEVKASSLFDSLARCFRTYIKTGQIASMRKHERCGGLGLFFFHSLVTDEVEIWPAQPVCQIYYDKGVKLLDYQIAVLSHANVPNYARKICENPAWFYDQVMAKRTRV